MRLICVMDYRTKFIYEHFGSCNVGGKAGMLILCDMYYMVAILDIQWLIFLQFFSTKNQPKVGNPLFGEPQFHNLNSYYYMLRESHNFEAP